MLSFCRSALSCVCLFSFKERCARVCAPSVGGESIFFTRVYVVSTLSEKSLLCYMLRVRKIEPNVFLQCLPLHFVYSENLNVVPVLTLLS